MERFLAAESLLPVGLFPVGLRFPDSFGLILGFKLPRRIPRELLPLTSRVSVGVRRKLSGVKREELCLIPARIVPESNISTNLTPT